jgi:hypothetical protein
MVEEMWRVLRVGGIFFARLASSVGIEERIKQLEGRRYHLPDGSDRFLVDEQMLLATTRSLGAQMLEPLRRWSCRICVRWRRGVCGNHSRCDSSVAVSLAEKLAGHFSEWARLS